MDNAIITLPLGDIPGKEILRPYQKIMMNYPTVDSNQKHIGCIMKLHRHSNVLTENNKYHSNTPPPLHKCTGEMQHSNPSARGRIDPFQEYVVLNFFPVYLWCHLLKQEKSTLNLLRTARLNPKLSAQVALEGNFDFNKKPLVPQAQR